MQSSSIDNMELLNLDVGGDSFAINIIDVQEIRVLEGLRKMPDAPEGWLGVIDFRDIIVPIVDLRLVFRAPDALIKEKTVVVVVQSANETGAKIIGIVVDAVSDVISVRPDEIRKPPDVHDTSGSIVTGVFKHEDHIVLLLNVQRLLSVKDFEQVQTQMLGMSDAL